MATYVELIGLIDDPDMQKRVRYALLIAARQRRQAAQATVSDKTWADKVFRDSLETPMRYIVTLVVSSAQVSAAGAAVLDSDIQAVVNNLVPTLVTGEIV